MEKLSIIIPTYNEERHIQRTIKKILIFLNRSAINFEIIISDDGSSDRTANLVKEFQPSHSNVIILENRHFGKAATINFALSRAEGELCLLMDADSATEISELPKVLRSLKEKNADIAIASREGLTARRSDEPRYRHFLGRVFNKLVKIIVGLRFEDTQCGFKLFKTDVLRALAAASFIMNKKNLNLNYPLVTAFDVELLTLAQFHGHQVIEVPINWTFHPTKNINPMRDSIGMFVDLLTIKKNLLLGLYQTKG